LIFGPGCQFYAIDAADSEVETYQVPEYETPKMAVSCTHLPDFGHLKGSQLDENLPIIQKCKSLADKTECESYKHIYEKDKGKVDIKGTATCQWMCNEYQDYPYYFNWSTPSRAQQIVEDTLPALSTCSSVSQYCVGDVVTRDYQYDFNNIKSILELMCCQCGRGNYVLPSLRAHKCTHRNT